MHIVSISPATAKEKKKKKVLLSLAIKQTCSGVHQKVETVKSHFKLFRDIKLQLCYKMSQTNKTSGKRKECVLIFLEKKKKKYI